MLPCMNKKWIIVSYQKNICLEPLQSSQEGLVPISATGSSSAESEKDAKAEQSKNEEVKKETAGASSGPAEGEKKEEDKAPEAAKAATGASAEKKTTVESKSSASGSTGITNSVEEVFDGNAKL